jgi:hypothetical protein
MERTTTEYTELQPLLSGVHSVMRVKSVLAGEGGGFTPTPSHYIYPHQQSCSVRSSLVGRYTEPVSSLPIYSFVYKLCEIVDKHFKNFQFFPVHSRPPPPPAISPGRTRHTYACLAPPPPPRQSAVPCCVYTQHTPH